MIRILFGYGASPGIPWLIGLDLAPLYKRPGVPERDEVGKEVKEHESTRA
jgi:hypothetical protein